MDEKGYQGYPNRSTWAVALHVNNDQLLQRSVYALMRATPTADDLEAFIRPMVTPLAYLETFGDVPLSQWVRMHNSVMASDVGDPRSVDWRYLAETFAAEAAETGD